MLYTTKGYLKIYNAMYEFDERILCHTHTHTHFFTTNLKHSIRTPLARPSLENSWNIYVQIVDMTSTDRWQRTFAVSFDINWIRQCVKIWITRWEITRAKSYSSLLFLFFFFSFILFWWMQTLFRPVFIRLNLNLFGLIIIKNFE